MTDWFGACMTVKFYKKGMDKEFLNGLASAFFNLHFYTNYTTNTIVIIGDAKAVDNAISLLRNKLKGKILTSAYSMLEHHAFHVLEKTTH